MREPCGGESPPPDAVAQARVFRWTALWDVERYEKLLMVFEENIVSENVRIQKGILLERC